MRADKGLHLIYPSAWTPNAYHPYSAAPSLDGNPTMTLRDPVGYLNLEVIQDLELLRMLKGDFDLVLEWEGFDLASPADNAPDLFRYPCWKPEWQLFDCVIGLGVTRERYETSAPGNKYPPSTSGAINANGCDIVVDFEGGADVKRVIFNNYTLSNVTAQGLRLRRS